MASKMDVKNSDITALQKQELEESTSCCICADIYKIPKLLPCGHIFCMKCIEETGLKANKGPGDEMSCPICRQQFEIPSDGFSGLQNNYYVEYLIRVAKLSACDVCLEENQEENDKEVKTADMYCIECMQKLCEECCRHHRKLKLTKNHKLIAVNDQRPTDADLIQSLVPSVCKIHKQEDLKKYCLTCKTLMCSICFSENHEGHKRSHVTKVVDEFRRDLASNTETVETYISQAQLKKSELEEEVQGFRARLESLECGIKERKDRLNEVADKHANLLLSELYLLKQSRLKEIKMKTDDIDAYLSRLESHNSYCKKIMTKGSPCDICRAVGDLSERMSDLQQENQALIQWKLKPFTLCFEGAEFEEKDGVNMFGQLKDCFTEEETMEEGQKEAGSRSKDRTRNNETLELQPLKKDDKLILSSGEEDSNSENINNEKKNKKRKRKLKNQEPKVVSNENKDKGRDDFEKKGMLKKADQSGNLKHQVSIPDLPPPKNTEHSENPKHEVKYSDLPPSNSADHAEHLRQKALSPEVATLEDTQHSQNVKHSAQNRHFSDFAGRQENPTDNTEQERICALKLLPSVDIDEDIFYYLFRHQNHELSRISKKCNVFELYKVKQRHKLAVEVRPGHEMKSVLAEFLKLYEQATVHDIRLPDGVDSESLRSLVDSMDDFKDVELRFMSKERVCKIVGASKDVTLAKQKLLEVITSNTNPGYDAPFNGKGQSSVQLTQTPNGKESARRVEWYHSTASQVHQAGRSAFKVLKQSYDSLLLAVSNCLTILVKRDDLTKLRDVDVVVSCINHQLETDGQMANQVIRAAGTKVETELVIHKSQILFLHTGNLVHTSGGNLGGVKALVHVVRPQIFEFPPNEQKSRDFLRSVFINCFYYTNDKLRLNSICLPPIGFELYGAEMVVSCFLDAAEIFASTVNNPSAAYHQHPQHLNCIQLVSNESFCFGELIKCFKRRL